MSAWNGDMSARAAGLIESWKSRGIETSTNERESSSRMQWEGLGVAFDLQQDQSALSQSMTITGIPDDGFPDVSLSASRVEQHLSFDSAFDFDLADPVAVSQSFESSIAGEVSAETGFGNVLAAFNATHSSTVEWFAPTGIATQSVDLDSVTETFEFSAADGSFSMSGGSVLEEMSSVASTSSGFLEMTDASSLTETMSMNGDGYSLDIGHQQSTSITQLTEVAPTTNCEFASVTELATSSEQMSFSSGDMMLDFSRTETSQTTITNFSPSAPSQDAPAIPDMPGSVFCGGFPDLNLQLPQADNSPMNLCGMQNGPVADFNLSLDTAASFDFGLSPFASATDLGGHIGASIQRPLELGISASV